MCCISGEWPDTLCSSMKTGAIIATLFPSTTTCPSCLSQQFQQQHQQQL
jgi:hypothetical protein